MNEVCLGRGKDRKALPLGKLLGEGAAGKVYSLPAMPGAAAKLYHGEEEARRHEAKVEAMIANPPDLPPALHQGTRYPQIAWPQAKLYDRTGRFIGFLMPEIDFGRSTSLVNLLQKNSRKFENLSEYYGYRVLVARNLASVFAELHRAGHHMIDMKPANLRFYPKVSWMAVVDTDGFSITGHHGRIAADQLSDEFIAPESWKRPIGELGVDQDQFALAVIIFQLLDNGVHPFAGGSVGARGQATDLQARILDGLYPYALKPPAGLVPSTASVHRMFRRSTREMFDDAFLPGRRRPTAEQWRDHLDMLISQLVPCAARPEEHVHFGSGCGFCGHEARVELARAKAPAKRVQKPGTRRPLPQVPQPGPARTLTARPLPMLPARPMMMQAPPPRRRRKPWVAWQSLAVVLLLGGTAFATQSVWRPMLGVPDGTEANDTALPRLEIPEAKITRFAEPHDYLILPTGGALSIPLYRGPGEKFPVVDRLSLHDLVIGRGTARGADNMTWIYVVRDSDGMAGFVPLASVLERRPSGFAEDRTATADNGMLARKYRKLLDGSDGYDRAYLSETQKLWEEDRQRCEVDADPAGCRRNADEQRLTELDSWAVAQKQAKEPLAPPDPGLAAIDAQH